jgi:hypothetical protein
MPPLVLDLTATATLGPRGRRSWRRRCWPAGEEILAPLLLARGGGDPVAATTCSRGRRSWAPPPLARGGGGL